MNHLDPVYNLSRYHSESNWDDTVSFLGSDEVKEAKNILSMFNLIGCPLLLACMCVERYLAVIRPVLYLRVRRWEYRVAVSAAVWLLTLLFCVAAGLIKDMIKMMVPVSIIISCLFIIMVTCLGGVVWSLWHQNPALSGCGNRPHCVSPLKRQAVDNVMAVVVPAVISYFPVLTMFPLVLYKFYWNNGMDAEMCIVFELSQLFPQFGLLIGPLFYLAKAKQICTLCTKVNSNQ
ncbi:uncharacterized protein FYW49_019674 [Xenentodon cancila]